MAANSDIHDEIKDTVQLSVDDVCASPYYNMLSPSTALYPSVVNIETTVSFTVRRALLFHVLQDNSSDH